MTNSDITWIPVVVVGLFLVFGWLRLLFGAMAKNRRIVELEGYSDTYGALLTQHHGAKESCDDAITRARAATTTAIRMAREADARARQATRLADERTAEDAKAEVPS